jgi:hypothetical protein
MKVEIDDELREICRSIAKSIASEGLRCLTDRYWQYHSEKYLGEYYGGEPRDGDGPPGFYFRVRIRGDRNIHTLYLSADVVAQIASGTDVQLTASSIRPNGLPVD